MKIDSYDIKHFFVYNVEQSDRNPAIARYLGLPEITFSNTLEGVRNFCKVSEDVVQKAIANGSYKELADGRIFYYLKSLDQSGARKGNEVGIIVIKTVQTINGITKEYFQSMMPSTLEYFLEKTMSK